MEGYTMLINFVASIILTISFTAFIIFVFGRPNSKLNEMPWWTRSDVSHSDWFEENKKEIKFHKHSAEWDKTLLWNQDETKLEKVPSWKPKIIDGGKTQH